MTLHFFSELDAFDDFTSFANTTLYSPLPDDWLIAMTDIVSSGEALEQGRYKDVNLMGASGITACLNAVKSLGLKNQDIPYIFGGDGCTLAIPASAAIPVKEALRDVINLSRERFGLKMRAALIPVSAIREQNKDICVARFRISPGNYIALFSGGGVELSEYWMKSDQHAGQWNLPDNDSGRKPDLSGLTCRWSPLDARKGVMLTLLISSPLEDEAKRLDALNSGLRTVQETLGLKLQDHNPAQKENTSVAWPPSAFLSECRAHASGSNPLSWIGAALKILSESAIQIFAHSQGKTVGSYNAPRYHEQLLRNTDFRRFDDTLRLVLDCSEKEKQTMEKRLTELQDQGLINFGMQASSSALMTCLVFDLSKGNHLHFVDGSDGGFALAAKALKEHKKQ
ncbi:DUF3095 domain-containing protein [Kiloniella sp. b19]|uniref:DUF3095 domain-containing protein n=1 Tax=Kiloniella sp. GXU_MW_B19 TaxID=3141326 RepID=UPI0031E3F5A5